MSSGQARSPALLETLIPVLILVVFVHIIVLIITSFSVQIDTHFAEYDGLLGNLLIGLRLLLLLWFLLSVKQNY